jgi:hypothetical protein
LARDLVAGLTLAAIAIPEQMATARFGRFPPEIVFLPSIGPHPPVPESPVPVISVVEVGYVRRSEIKVDPIVSRSGFKACPVGFHRRGGICEAR